jgi:hypothetical protein
LNVREFPSASVCKLLFGRVREWGVVKVGDLQIESAAISG